MGPEQGKDAVIPDSMIYRKVPDFLGYMISREGQIISCRNSGRCGLPEGWYKLNPQKKYAYRSGGPVICLYQDRTGKRNLSVGRLILMAWQRRPEDNEVAEYVDEHDSRCVLSNLRWATPKQVIAHAIDRNGAWMRGENAYQSKLSAEDVTRIRDMYFFDKVPQVDIAKQFNIASGRVSEIIRFRKWKSVGWPPPEAAVAPLSLKLTPAG